ncbi:MAG: class I SAM-dependent methyltransferase [Chloroflexi bacterium]|nr:class I SAM-dependent methyltransferase [Chloroflexota bacterium]MBV9597892.1 class I SAM-dependent methyltransferase [Chloroflexota bacterium]
MTTSTPTSELHEDWFDERWVAHWIDRQRAREPQRNRQFGLLRAMLPFGVDTEFTYLNVGSGPGTFDELVLQRYPRARSILVDVSPLMLERARERLRRFADRTSYIQADFSTRDWTSALDDTHVHAVVSCIAIHNLREPALIRALYADLYGLLVDGGLFLNLDYVRMPAAELQAMARWAGADPEGGFMPGGGGSGMPGTADEQVGWVREAGFIAADCFYKEFRLALFGGCKGALRVPEAR